MDSRKSFVWVAIGLVALLVAFAVISIVTGNPAFVLWAVVPIVMAFSTVVAAIRGATKGDRKRDRDARLAAQKGAQRAARHERGQAGHQRSRTE